MIQLDASNIPLDPTSLSVKHCARVKSTMLATEPCGSAERYTKARDRLEG